MSEGNDGDGAELGGDPDSPWESGKVVKKSLKARAFRKVDRRDIREVEIEVVRAPLVRHALRPTQETAAAPAPVKEVRQTAPQAIPVAAFRAATAPAVVKEIAKPGARSAEDPHLPSSAIALPRTDRGPALGALLAIADALYKDVGHPGTILQTPRGVAFSVRHDVGTGEVRTEHALPLPLPEGHATSHTAALAIELENRAQLVLDIVASTTTLADLKAHGFDALQFRRNSRCFTILVFVRLPGPGITQAQAESIAHGYDLFFGVEEEHARSEQRYSALRSRVQSWLQAAAKA
ncbi:MAG: hypothetical protein ACYDBQ_04080 [Thermoplasmatota archaeon]